MEEHRDDPRGMVRPGSAGCELLAENGFEAAHRWLACAESLRVEDMVGVLVVLEPR